MDTDRHRYFLEPRKAQNTKKCFNPVEFHGIRSFNCGESATINRVDFQAFGLDIREGTKDE